MELRPRKVSRNSARCVGSGYCGFGIARAGGLCRYQNRKKVFESCGRYTEVIVVSPIPCRRRNQRWFYSETCLRRGYRKCGSGCSALLRRLLFCGGVNALPWKKGGDVNFFTRGRFLLNRLSCFILCGFDKRTR